MQYGTVSIPYGNSARYDCVFEYNNKLYKIQIKTARMIDENRFAVPFSNSRISKHGIVRKTYTNVQVDFIATIVKDNVYLIEVKNYIKRLMTLNFQYPKNGIKRSINLAKEYELQSVLQKL